MNSYTRSHLTDQGLLSGFTTRLSLDRETTAELLADLAEIEERKLYVRAAYASMHLYCVHEFHMSEETAFKRMRAARAAHKFPTLYPALADGRLHLTAVVLLAPHLTPETVNELLTAASHRTKSEIELLVAERFPRPDVPTTVRALTPAGATEEPAMCPENAPELELSPGTVAPEFESKSAGRTGPIFANGKAAPLSAERFEWHLTVSKRAQEKLRRAQALLGHAVPSGDLSEVLERALDALVEKLEKRKFAKTDLPRPQKGPTTGRHIPAAVKRAVVERDGGQCTFVSDKGKRCESRTRLEFDHAEPLARGGQATISGIRLRCRAHSQYAAECVLAPSSCGESGSSSESGRPRRRPGRVSRSRHGRRQKPRTRKRSSRGSARLDVMSRRPAERPRDAPEWSALRSRSASAWRCRVWGRRVRAASCQRRTSQHDGAERTNAPVRGGPAAIAPRPAPRW